MSNLADENMRRFLELLAGFPQGTFYGNYFGRRYAISVSHPLNLVTNFYAEELGGKNIVSFNLYHTDMENPVLKPCEMSSSKIIDFILNVDLASKKDG